MSMDTGLKLHEAIRFATLAHINQKRKGSELPYIVHPYEVAMIISQMGGNESTIIAGMLHDTIEDTDISYTDIALYFDIYVAELVRNNSEDKLLSWEERKQHTINSLGKLNIWFYEKDKDEFLLLLADKLSNLRSLYQDYQILGDELWNIFDRPYEQQKWYYENLLKEFKDIFQRHSLTELKLVVWIDEFESLFNKVFDK